MLSAVSHLHALRDSIARIERLGPIGDGRSARPMDAHQDACVTLGNGELPLDGVLGGGIRRGALHEVVAASPRDEAASSGFAVSLAVRCAGEGALVWIVDDRAAWETGTPYRPGLACHGLRPDKLVLVKTRDAHTTLWATEEALRAGAPVVLTELWRARSYDLAASRRLLLAARRKGGTCLLVHVGLSSSDDVSSGADTRFGVAASPGHHRPSAGTIPLPGLASFAVRLLKMRGATADGLSGFDRDEAHALVWDRDSLCFKRGDRWHSSMPHAVPERASRVGSGAIA